jgi:hypothetical protein
MLEWLWNLLMDSGVAIALTALVVVIIWIVGAIVFGEPHDRRR